MSSFLFELCAETLAAARAAELGGADRLELCEQLAIGGVTPSVGLLDAALKSVHIPIHVLIRPRGGDFQYTPRELDRMRDEVDVARRMGAAGVVLGVLNANGHVDVEATQRLVERARPMQVTFHRAFDQAPDLVEALEAVVATGADCLLTSGGAADVQTGIPALARLRRQAADRIQILGGGGLKLAAIEDVMQQTGLVALHGSLSSRLSGSESERMEQLAGHVRAVRARMQAVVQLKGEATR